jgi:hypothetical protein
MYIVRTNVVLGFTKILVFEFKVFYKMEDPSMLGLGNIFKN